MIAGENPHRDEAKRGAIPVDHRLRDADAGQRGPAPASQSGFDALISPQEVATYSTEGSLDDFPLAQMHLARYPFRAPANAHECVAWFEGSFNPLHEGHVCIVQRLVSMGFRTVIVGTVPENPYKDPSTIYPFHLRVEAVREHFRDMGLPLVNNSEEPGVFITSTRESFQDERLKAWYRDTWYVVMGPDNFQTYFGEDRAWALFAAQDPEMRDFTRFRRLYENVLRERILVNDKACIFHAEHIRRGVLPMLPAVERVLHFRNRPRGS